MIAVLAPSWPGSIWKDRGNSFSGEGNTLGGSTAAGPAKSRLMALAASSPPDRRPSVHSSPDVTPLQPKSGMSNVSKLSEHSTPRGPAGARSSSDNAGDADAESDEKKAFARQERAKRRAENLMRPEDDEARKRHQLRVDLQKKSEAEAAAKSRAATRKLIENDRAEQRAAAAPPKPRAAPAPLVAPPELPPPKAAAAAAAANRHMTRSVQKRRTVDYALSMSKVP